jgi:cysteine sulfinate desulfinase/cysteine desulfurase-like protein
MISDREVLTLNRIYLDHGATTPPHADVIEAMLPYFRQHFGNPSSVHSFGREAVARWTKAGKKRP